MCYLQVSLQGTFMKLIFGQFYCQANKNGPITKKVAHS